jgi:hypothetical protein
VDRSGTIDRNISGLVKVYFYAGGRTAGQKPVGFSGSVADAETLFPNWTSATHSMDNLIFALVSVDYNREKSVTGIGKMNFNVASTMFSPGDVLYDYLTNTTYGAGIESANILTADIAALNTYSQIGVAYDDQGTGTETLADRYQINGLLDSKNKVLENAEAIVNACASWLSYDSHVGKWGVVINKSDTSIASFNDSNIVGNITVSGTGLQDLYNTTEIKFPHRELRDNLDVYKIDVPTSSIPSDWVLFARNANEEVNPLILTYDIINEPVQAQLLGLIELKQSRIDKIVEFSTNFDYYNLKAGDVIDVTNSRFGFSSKAFRIINITEVHDDLGSLIMSIQALEYDASVYSIADLYRFTRSNENGILPLGSIGAPGTPVVSKVEQDARPRIEVSTTAPTGLVEGIEYWLTTDTTITDDASRSYTLIATKKPVGGGVYTSGTVVVLSYDTLGSGDFYIKTRGFNTNTVGTFSSVSGLVEFVPQQTTDAIGPETGMLDGTGGLIAGLAAVQLLGKLSDLIGETDIGQSIFSKIFDTFEEVTGIDLVGDASDGGLVVAADLAVKADGTSLGATTSSINFVGPIIALGSGNVEVKLLEGNKNKDILAWNSDDQQWQLISDCVACEFENVPPEALGDAIACSLVKASTLPINNFQAAGALCPASTSVPYTGSYFIKFNIDPGNKPPEATSASTILEDEKYTIAQPGNTDWSWWGFEDGNVGTSTIAQDPLTLWPNGKNANEITVGKRYTIVSGGGTSASKTDFTLIGAASNAAGTEFTATGNSDGRGIVGPAGGSGWVYGRGEANDPISLIAPLVKGTGNFELYGTDGVREQSLSIADCVIHNNVVEIPFKNRSPGKDYYIVYNEGIVTNCNCENISIDDSEIWTFTTSETPVPAYALTSIAPTNIPDSSTSDVFDRSLLDFDFSPLARVCAQGQRLILTFETKVIKGSGSITLVDRQTKSIVESFLASTVTISEIEAGGSTVWQVDCGAIPSLTADAYYDFNVPRGFLVTESLVGSSVYCDKTTNSPAPPSRSSNAKTWGINAGIALKVTRVEYCSVDNGAAKLRTNIKITFNKLIKTKPGVAEITIKGGLFGSTFQKIDLNGNYATKKYGDIYSGGSSSADDPSTATDEQVDDYSILVNPTKMFDTNTTYHITIPSGIILDLECNEEWSGVSDSTTITWKTDGAAPTAPQGLTYGSVLMDLEYDRPITLGYGKMIIKRADGQLLTTISALDLAVKIKYNQRF